MPQASNGRLVLQPGQITGATTWLIGASQRLPWRRQEQTWSVNGACRLERMARFAGVLQRQEQTPLVALRSLVLYSCNRAKRCATR